MEQKLFDHYSALGKLDHLRPIDVEKFRFACKKAVAENPHLGFDDLCAACTVYLNFINDFPDLNLGDVQQSKEP